MKEENNSGKSSASVLFSRVFLILVLSLFWFSLPCFHCCVFQYFIRDSATAEMMRIRTEVNEYKIETSTIVAQIRKTLMHECNAEGLITQRERDKFESFHKVLNTSRQKNHPSHLFNRGTDLIFFLNKNVS